MTSSLTLAGKEGLQTLRVNLLTSAGYSGIPDKNPLNFRIYIPPKTTVLPRKQENIEMNLPVALPENML